MAEYDRALFRVYERILEDLNASPSPLLTVVHSSTNTAGGRRFQFVDDSGDAQNDAMEGEDTSEASQIETSQENDGENGNDSNVNNNRRQRRRRQHTTERDAADTTNNIIGPNRNGILLNSNLHRQHNQHEIPFFLSIGMSLRLNKWIQSYRNYTASHRGRMLFSSRGLFQRLHNDEDEAAPSTPTRYRSLLIHSSNDIITSSHHHDVEAAVVNYNRDNINTALNMPRLEDNSSPTTTTTLTRDGLRRRTSSSQSPRRASPDSSTNSILTSSSASSHSNGVILASSSSPPSSPISLQPRYSSSSEEYSFNSSSEGSSTTDDVRLNSPPSSSLQPTTTVTATSLTQRAIQHQLSQRRRYRRTTTNNNDDSSTENDDDDSTSSSESIQTNRESGGCNQHTLYKVMRFTFLLGLFHIGVLAVLHRTYVGPHAFRRQVKLKTVADDDDVTSQRRWLLLGNKNNVTTTTMTTCITEALKTREIEERSRYHVLFGDHDTKSRKLLRDNDGSDVKRTFSDEDDGVSFPSNATSVDFYYYDDDDPYRSRLLEDSQQTNELPLLGKDEILQVKILYGGTCTGKCSRVRRVVYPESVRITERKRLFHKRLPAVANKTNNNTMEEASSNTTTSGTGLRGLTSRKRQLTNDMKLQNTTFNPKENASNNSTSSSSSNTKSEGGVDHLSSPDFWQDPHYRFAIDDALLYLDEKSIYLHNITIVNVTVTERCLSTGSDDGSLTYITSTGEFLSQIYGMDSIMMNQFMFGIRSADGAALGGHVQNMETKERWGWRKDQIESFESTSVADWLPNKIGVLFMSLLSFFLITSVTALIVRVLTSSGVVLMFPLFEIIRNGGVPGADERILALSYPWIGAARRAIRTNQTHPQSHLVYAHMTKIVLYYVMYEACQAAWSVVLYSKSIPEALPVWIYGLAMITEYFSMVFVRSAISVHFFPRITLLYFVAYHVYFYSVSYGYFDLALIPLLLFMTHAMLFTVFLEAPNAARGTVSVECPREVYNKLSWPEWSAQLPPEWTIFLPLNMRQTPLHDRQVAQAEGPIEPAAGAVENNS